MINQPRKEKISHAVSLPDSQEIFQECESTNGEKESLYIGHFGFSFFFLVIQTPILLSSLYFVPQQVFAEYGDKILGVFVLLCLMCLALLHRTRQLYPRRKLGLIFTLVLATQITSAVLVGLVLKRYESRVDYAFVNCSFLVATSSILVHLCYVIDLLENKRRQPQSQVRSSSYFKPENSWELIIQAVLLLSIYLLLTGSLFYVAFDFTLKTQSILYWNMASFIVLIHASLSANMFLLKFEVETKIESRPFIQIEVITMVDVMAQMYIHLAKTAVVVGCIFLVLVAIEGLFNM